ncbi:hypothetical protein Vadar_004233 [Vaccinium darrowii]|uniref:Uncharacterized protein n=1 Tax=Vaccinium darrowii TaxID=229202 RepID=A0ACB7XFC7_9ERIC|nr:hypothetical protein Vadar_004233 [Vaccinium darrowii]
MHLSVSVMGRRKTAAILLFPSDPTLTLVRLLLDKIEGTNHMSEMFVFHATMMSNTLGTSVVVFTKTGFMAMLLSHYWPSGTIFAFTNEKTVQQRLALYQGVRPI